MDVDLMDDPGFVAHQAAERHMAAVWAAFYAEEDGEEGEELVESPAFGPFCGCDTCIIREVFGRGLARDRGVPPAPSRRGGQARCPGPAGAGNHHRLISLPPLRPAENGSTCAPNPPMTPSLTPGEPHH